MYRTWLEEWNQKLCVYCCEVWSAQCYQAGDYVVLVHMFVRNAVISQANCIAALVCTVSRVLVVRKSA